MILVIKNPEIQNIIFQKWGAECFVLGFPCGSAGKKIKQTITKT